MKKKIQTNQKTKKKNQPQTNPKSIWIENVVVFRQKLDV